MIDKPLRSASAINEGKKECTSEYDLIADTARLFSHPDRIGCANPKLLVSLARSKGALSREMRTSLHEHLLGCYLCNDEYLAIRESSDFLALKQIRLFCRKFSDTIAFSTLQIFFDFNSKSFLQSYLGWALVTLGVFSLAAMIWLMNTQRLLRTDLRSVASLRQTESLPEDMRNIPSDSETIQPNTKEGAPPTATNVKSRTRSKDQNRLTPTRLTVNLDDIWVSRGGYQQSKSIVCRNSLTVLSLKLPKNCPSGIYDASVLDPFGKMLISRRSLSTHEGSLTIHIDFRHFVVGDYILSLSRESSSREHEKLGYYALRLVSR